MPFLNGLLVSSLSFFILCIGLDRGMWEATFLLLLSRSHFRTFNSSLLHPNTISITHTDLIFYLESTINYIFKGKKGKELSNLDSYKKGAATKRNQGDFNQSIKQPQRLNFLNPHKTPEPNYQMIFFPKQNFYKPLKVIRTHTANKQKKKPK